MVAIMEGDCVQGLGLELTLTQTLDWGLLWLS